MRVTHLFVRKRWPLLKRSCDSFRGRSADEGDKTNRPWQLVLSRGHRKRKGGRGGSDVSRVLPPHWFHRPPSQNLNTSYSRIPLLFLFRFDNRVLTTLIQLLKHHLIGFKIFLKRKLKRVKSWRYAMIYFSREFSTSSKRDGHKIKLITT